MWYHDIKKDGWSKIIEEKLTGQRGYIDLGDVSSSLYDHNLDCEAGIPGIREKTLTYLQDLLEREELTVGRVKRVPKGETPPPIDENDHSSVFEDIPGTNKEIIEYIRDNWDNNPDFNEQWDCVFRLPENPWPPTYHVGR